MSRKKRKRTPTRRGGSRVERCGGPEQTPAARRGGRSPQAGRQQVGGERRSFDPRLGAILAVAGFAAYLILFLARPFPPSKRFTADNQPLTRAATAAVMLEQRSVPDVWFNFRHPKFNMLDRLPILVVGLAWWLMAWLAGRLMLDALGLSGRLRRLEIEILALGAGLNALSLVVLLLGLAGALHQPIWLWVLGGALIAVSAWRWVARRQPAARATMSKDERASPPHGKRERDSSGEAAPRWVCIGGLVLGAATAAVILLGAMLPPTDFDVREYHLQVPKEWYRQGSIDFLPHNVYGNMPMGSELHAVGAMMLMPGEDAWSWGALAGKTIMGGYAILTALLLLAAGRRWFGAAAGMVAALVYLTTPWIAKVSMAGLNDAVLGFYVFAACYVVVLSRGSEVGRGRHTALLLLAGWLAGAAAATKYTGVVFAVLPLAVVAVWPRRKGAAEPGTGRASATRAEPPLDSHLPGNDDQENAVQESVAPTSARPQPRRRAAMAGLFLLAAAAAGGPWYIKNWVLTGNPTYPLLYGVFGGRSRTPELAERWRRAHRVPVIPGREEYQADLRPTRLASDLKNIALDSPWQSPLYVPLVIAAVAWRPVRQRLAPVLALVGVILAVWWLATHRIDRFWLPTLPLLALAAGAGAAAWREPIWQIGAGCLLAVGLAINFYLINCPSPGAHSRLLVSLDDLRQVSTRPEHAYVNRETPLGKSVLLVGGAEPFDLQPRAYYSTCFDPCVFEELVAGKSPGEQWRALAARNIALVVVNWAEIERYRSPGNYGYTDFVQPEVFEQLVRDGVLTPAEERLGIYHVPPRWSDND